jgi:hypothetical protein
MAIVTGSVTRSYVFHVEEVVKFIEVDINLISERQWRGIADVLARHLKDSVIPRGAALEPATCVPIQQLYFTADMEVVKAAVLTAYKNIR